MQDCGVQEWDSYDRVFQRPRQAEKWGHHRESGERDSCGTKCFITVYSFVVEMVVGGGGRKTHNIAKLNKVWFLHVCFTQVSPYPGVMGGR